MTSDAQDFRFVAESGERLPEGLGRFWLLQVCGWLAFGALMLAWGVTFLPLPLAALNKTIITALGLVLSCGLRAAYRHLPARPAALPALVPIVTALCGLGGLLWYEAATMLFAWCLEPTTGLQWHPLSIGTFVFYASVLVIWSLLYFGLRAWRTAAREQMRAEQAEASAHSARLRALQAQLQPHFLFNALNSVLTLVREVRNAEAARMLVRLADFLRLTQDTLESPEVTVTEEIRFAREYLEIERARFGERLRVSIDVVASAWDALVPVLILQPLIENAVKYGLTAERGGAVGIRVSVASNQLTIAVDDEGAGAPAPAGRGLGLSNCLQRLRTLHGDAAGAELQRSATGASILLWLPLRRRSAPGKTK